jgi:cytochrome c-type biogenesis protein CcmE
MKLGKTFVSLVVVFVVVGSLMVFQATKGTAASMVSPNDLLERPDEDRSRIRVAGRVVGEGLEYQVQPKIVLRFRVSDPGDPKGTVPVVYEGLKPDMFTSGRDVLIDGDFTSGEILASQVLTQCPSKYEPPSPAGAESTGKE